MKKAKHEIFDGPVWSDIPLLVSLKDKARDQLGTVGSGNHYVDIFVHELDRVFRLIKKKTINGALMENINNRSRQLDRLIKKMYDLLLDGEISDSSMREQLLITSFLGLALDLGMNEKEIITYFLDTKEIYVRISFGLRHRR